MNKWKADSNIQKKIEFLIGQAHPELVDIIEDIVVVFKDKSSKVGGKISLGKVLKAPGILSVLGDREYQFIFEMGFDVWNTITDEHQDALLDHFLCHIGVEEDDKNGDRKYFLQSPDVCYFSNNLSRYENWQQEVDTLVNPQNNQNQQATTKTGKKTKPQPAELVDLFENKDDL
jgi:hypothetical protein